MKAHLVAASGLALAAAVACAPAALAATSGCTLSQFSVPGLSATYDPFDMGFSPTPVTVTARAVGDCKGARIQLALSPSPTNPQTGGQVRLTQGAATILATVEDSSGQPKPIVAQGAAFTTNPVSMPIGSAGAITGGTALQLDMAQGQVSPPGSYTAILTLIARLTDSKGQSTESTTPLVLNLLVKPSVRLAAGAGNLNIDLGELKSGVVGGPVNFDAYANVDYDLRIKSDNGFVLRPNGHGSAAGVPYVPTVSNSTLSSTSAQGGGPEIKEVSFGAPVDGLRRHALRVTVQPFPALAAGTYSDVMTVEIRAKI